MTPAEPDAPAEPTTDQVAEQPRTRRRWPWLVLLVLGLAAVLGMVLGTAIVLRGRSFGASLGVDAAARPTFVVVSAPSPSPTGSPRPAAPPAATESDTYAVEPGDTLRSIAERMYGDAAQWARIYDANRETIGPNPDSISAGTRLRIPRP